MKADISVKKSQTRDILLASVIKGGTLSFLFTEVIVNKTGFDGLIL